MDNLELAFTKLKAYSVLPQPEYVAMAREVMGDIKNEMAERNTWKEHYEIEQSVKFMGLVMKLGDSQNKATYNFNDYDYELSVTKTKSKK